MSTDDAYTWAWKSKLLDKPRRERWVALDLARKQGHEFPVEDLLDALGLDCEAFADLFKHLPQDERRAAARAESKRRGLGFSAPALIDAFSGSRW